MQRAPHFAISSPTAAAKQHTLLMIDVRTPVTAGMGCLNLFRLILRPHPCNVDHATFTLVGTRDITAQARQLEGAHPLQIGTAMLRISLGVVLGRAVGASHVCSRSKRGHVTHAFRRTLCSWVGWMLMR